MSLLDWINISEIKSTTVDSVLDSLEYYKKQYQDFRDKA